MASNDGKRAEKKFTAEGKDRMKDPLWWVHRFPDAAVCRGRIPKQPADYLVLYKGVPAALVEVKETQYEDKIETARLTQRPKMRRFMMAGGLAYFVVYHYNHGFWRLVPAADTFEAKKSSVRLTDYKALPSVKEIYDAIRYSM